MDPLLQLSECPLEALLALAGVDSPVPPGVLRPVQGVAALSGVLASPSSSNTFLPVLQVASSTVMSQLNMLAAVLWPVLVGLNLESWIIQATCAYC